MLIQETFCNTSRFFATPILFLSVLVSVFIAESGCGGKQRPD
jgi:hypothetical protein